MSVISTLQSMIEDYIAQRERARTTRLVNALPSEIQKDIGWPGFYPEHGVGRGNAHLNRIHL